MQKTDKVFAGLIVLSLIAFWVIIAPAGVTSRISEASPTTNEPAPVVSETKRTQPTSTSRQTQRPTEPRLSKAQLARLKRRNTDTPPGAREQMLRSIQDGANLPETEATDPRGLERMQDTPGLKQLY